MLIRELALTNFRVYAGEHRFDLTPRTNEGEPRSIILFGGLNGSGKTSVLTGVRLALYGKAALGRSVSQRQYENYLLESIHRSRETNRAAGGASVDLTFSYAKLGVETQFHVIRSWERKGKSVKENLQITENGEPIKGLSYEQGQHFLNELIPIGVSDLFFFDGEKIAELADDTGGAELENAIKKLLGLDVVERLSGDLTVLNRNIVRQTSNRSIENEIEETQDLLDKCRYEVERLRQEISTVTAKRSESALQADQLNKAISDRGGHFSASREELEKQLDKLNSDREAVTTKITYFLNDAAPLALADIFCARLEEQIEQDLRKITQNNEYDLLAHKLDQLNHSLQNKLSQGASIQVRKEVKALLAPYEEEKKDYSPIHDLTPAQAGTLFSNFKVARQQIPDIRGLFDELEAIETKVGEIGASLARAPDDMLVKTDFENLQKINETIGKYDAQLESLRESAKSQANKAVENARTLDKLYDEAAKHSDQRRVLEYINSTNGMLEDFVDHSATAKIRDLEHQFTECFSKLARKDDLSLQVRIDPKTFYVTLLSATGREIGKDELSAGEKQIFAISILEALAKTSGRQLPMIVDTPLGRLDSKHRRKLIESYFPRASHQMIILSTDTEVDESFYQDLAPDIARAYRLEYDSNTGATHVESDYFWQKKEVGVYVPDTHTAQ